MLTATIFMYVHINMNCHIFNMFKTFQLLSLNCHCSVIMLCSNSSMYPLLCLHCVYMIFSEGPMADERSSMGHTL